VPVARCAVSAFSRRSACCKFFASRFIACTYALVDLLALRARGHFTIAERVGRAQKCAVVANPSAMQKIAAFHFHSRLALQVNLVRSLTIRSSGRLRVGCATIVRLRQPPLSSSVMPQVPAPFLPVASRLKFCSLPACNHAGVFAPLAIHAPDSQSVVIRLQHAIFRGSTLPAAIAIEQPVSRPAKFHRRLKIRVHPIRGRL